MSIYCLSRWTINESRFWDSHVDKRYVSDHPLQGLLRLLLHERSVQAIFLRPHNPYLALLVLCLWRAVFLKRVTVIIQEFNRDVPAFRRRSFFRRLCSRTLLDIIVRGTDFLILHSRQQVEYLQQVYPRQRGKFKFIPLPKNHTVRESRFVEPEEEEDYVLVPGDERDFETVFRIVPRLQEMHIPVKIVTRSAHREEIAALQQRYECSNVRVHFDMPKSQYVSLLEKAKIVVIPSCHSGRSNGQLVLLDAYALGKAVICLEGRNISDYYSAGSVLTYRERDSEDLLGKIRLLCSDRNAITALKRKSYAYLDQFRDKEDFVRDIFAQTRLMASVPGREEVLRGEPYKERDAREV